MAKAPTPELKQVFESPREGAGGAGQSAGAGICRTGCDPQGQDVRCDHGHHRGRPRGDEGFKGMPALDVGLLAASQGIEHYEIARNGTLRTWAAELGLRQSPCAKRKRPMKRSPSLQKPGSISTHRHPRLEPTGPRNVRSGCLRSPQRRTLPQLFRQPIRPAPAGAFVFGRAKPHAAWTSPRRHCLARFAPSA
jgi:hypothetical protein